jgi:hypothetical protein
MNAQTAIQLLLMLDSISTQVFNFINSMKELSKDDEESLQFAIAEYRVKNDAKYRSVIAKLKAKAK